MTLWADLKVACRVLNKSRGFTLVVLLTLALGIGANTAIFSIVDAVLLRPLGFREPQQLVRVVDNAAGAGLRDIGMSVPELKDLALRSNIFEQISATWPISANLTGGGQPERIELLAVSPNYFQLLGVQARLGRVFGSEDTAQGFAEAVVLSDGLWKRLFGGDRNVLGRKVAVDNDVYTVVGVMPPDFRHPGKTVSADVEMWATAGFSAAPFPSPPPRAMSFLPGAIARMKPGLDVKQAQLRVEAFTAALRSEFPNDYPATMKWSVELEPMQDVVVGKSRTLLLVLLSAVAMMLLIGCANIANLLLARATGRQREIAIRQSLGAGRGRLVRQLLTESVLLSVLAGIAGLAATKGMMGLLLRAAPARIPRLHEVHINADVMLFALGISLVTGLLFGLAPALEASSVSLLGSLNEGGRSASGSRRQKRVSAVLVVAEVAVCIVLMTGAGLLVRSFQSLTHSDPGFDARNVLAASIWLPQPNDPKADPYARPEDRTVFVREVLRRVRQLPNVSAAAITNSLPMSGATNRLPVLIEGANPADGQVVAELVGVTPDYFQVLGTPVKRGRGLAESDQRDAQPVVVIDEGAARKFWPGQNPIGKRLKIGRAQVNPFATVVGIVGDIRHDGMEVDGVPHVYTSIYQRSNKAFGVVVRSARNPAPLTEPLRRAVQSVDPALPVFGVRPLEEMLEASLAQERFSAQIMALFAVLALGLAAIGIYGVLAYSIGQRTREIGIRLALGARGSEVCRMVVWHGMRLILVGTLLGLGCALALGGVLARLLFGVSPRDPLVFATVPGVLMLVALAASSLPAWRATRIDPVLALRWD